MFPIINIGPLSLPSSQFILLLSILLGSYLVEKQARKSFINAEDLFKIIWIAILAGILGARLSFVARNAGAFRDQWISVFSLNPALLDPEGGLLIALAAGYITAVKTDQADWSLLDKLVPFTAVLAPAIHLANFASGTDFGTLTGVPWGIELWGGNRHPVQLYYLIPSLVILYQMVFRYVSNENPAGTRMLSFVLYTSGYLTFFSSFQDPAGNLIGGYRTYQLICWFVFILCSLISLKIRMKESENAAD